MTIVMFSNPFGYGPTGVAIPVLRALLRGFGRSKIIFAGSDHCMEILTGVPVETVLLDERDEGTIETFLRKLKNPYVLGSQNRFCIRVAKKIGATCAFIDILAWLWEAIPYDHLIADEIFWIKFPGIEQKIPQDRHNIHLISSVITTKSPLHKKFGRLMVHIGGAQYPLSSDIPKSYLNLLARGLNGLNTSGRFDEFIFTGGSRALGYNKKIVRNKRVVIRQFPEHRFIDELAGACHMLTTAGVSSTLESFALKVPTSFLLPLNLSQYSFTAMLRQHGACPQLFQWNNYTTVNPPLDEMSEGAAISKIESLAKYVDESRAASQRFEKDFSAIANYVPENSGQLAFIKQLGDSGADELVEILKTKWNQ